jgi:hypothetical protein
LAVEVQDSSDQKRLFKKILARAWAKAENIAACNNQHAHEVLAVTENKAEESEISGWTSYPPLSALSESVIPGWHTTIRSPANIVIADSTSMDWYPLAGSFTVRFSVE